jgi:hypothetical protein
MPGDDVTVVANQFKLKLAAKTSINIYTMKVFPDIEDSFDRIFTTRTLIKSLDDKMNKLFNIFIHAGDVLYSTTCIEEEISLAGKGEGEGGLGYDLILNKIGEFDFDDIDNLDYTLRPKATAFVNNIMKKILRSLDLRQIGRLPRFYNPSGKIEIPEYEIEVWPGYEVNTNLFTSGFFLGIETMSKFIRTRSILRCVYDDQDEGMSQKKIKEKFIKTRVICGWGSQRTYCIDDIDFKLNPMKLKVDTKIDGENVRLTMVEYFKKKYNITLKDKDQPLIVINRKRGPSINLPPEICFEAGLPDEYFKDKNIMRELGKSKFLTPDQRMKSILELNSDIN